MGQKFDVVTEFRALMDEHGTRYERQIGSPVAALLWNANKVELQVPTIIYGRILRVENEGTPWVHIVQPNDNIARTQMGNVLGIPELPKN